jgi:hypothetical protein
LPLSLRSQIFYSTGHYHYDRKIFIVQATDKVCGSQPEHIISDLGKEI